MQVYVVFYYDSYSDAWLVGNVYYNRADANEEAKTYEGYVLTREVL